MPRPPHRDRRGPRTAAAHAKDGQNCASCHPDHEWRASSTSSMAGGSRPEKVRLSHAARASCFRGQDAQTRVRRSATWPHCRSRRPRAVHPSPKCATRAGSVSETTAPRATGIVHRGQLGKKRESRATNQEEFVPAPGFDHQRRAFPHHRRSHVKVNEPLSATPRRQFVKVRDAKGLLKRVEAAAAGDCVSCHRTRTPAASLARAEVPQHRELEEHRRSGFDHDRALPAAQRSATSCARVPRRARTASARSRSSRSAPTATQGRTPAPRRSRRKVVDCAHDATT